MSNANYRIAKLGQYYQPEIQGRDKVVILDDGYDTIAEAKAAIAALEGETYYLANGEAGRPDYYIVDNNVADYLETGRNYDMSNYDWDNAECDCGECNKCCAMMIEQDRQYVRNNKVEA